MRELMFCRAASRALTSSTTPSLLMWLAILRHRSGQKEAWAEAAALGETSPTKLKSADRVCSKSV
jgi:hypothetical protein